MESLFPQQTGQQAPLVNFKAGKCNLAPQEDGSFLVTPDLRKGKVTIEMARDRSMHLKWTDRSNNHVEDDFIVLPNEVVFSKVNTPNSSNRVYLLNWKNGSRRLMFWMQDKIADYDEANCKKVNQTINTPPQAQGNGADDLLRMLRGGRPQQRVQIADPPVTGEGNGNGNGGRAANNVIAGLDFGSLLNAAAQGRLPPAQQQAPDATTSNNTTTTVPSTPAPSQQSAQNTPGALTAEQLARVLRGDTGPQTNLNKVLNADAIISSGILNDDTVRNNLLALLPQGQQNPADLEINLRSPQFQQALQGLEEAIRQNYQGVLANLGIDPTPGLAIAQGGDPVGGFLESMAAAGEKRAREQASSQEEKKDDSGRENMDTSS